MSDNNDDLVRINIEIERPENDKLNRLLPRGTKSEVLRKLIIKMISDLENDLDGTFCAALLKGNVELTSVSPNEYS